MFLDGYVVSLSDTQAITTLALLISSYFFLGCSISAYHYDLVCSLVLMSSAAFIGSTVVMHRYFDNRWWLSLPRGAIVIACFVLEFLLFRRRTNIFPSYQPQTNIENPDGGYKTGLVLPATCFINHPGVGNNTNLHDFTSSINWTINATALSPSANSSMAGNATLTVPIANRSMSAFTNFESNDYLSSTGDMVALGFLFTAFVITIITNGILFIMEDTMAFHRWFAYPIRCIAFLISNIIAIFAIIRFKNLQGWMLASGWFVDDDGERSIQSFGQLMPLVLLILPALALIEQYAGESSHVLCKPRLNVMVIDC